MNTSVNKYDSIENLIFTEGLKISSIDFNESGETMFLHLNNEHTFVISTRLFSRLREATAQQLKNLQVIGNGTGIHWPELDEDLSLKGFLKEYLKLKVHSEKELVLR